MDSDCCASPSLFLGRDYTIQWSSRYVQQQFSPPGQEDVDNENVDLHTNGDNPLEFFSLMKISQFSLQSKWHSFFPPNYCGSIFRFNRNNTGTDSNWQAQEKISTSILFLLFSFHTRVIDKSCKSYGSVPCQDVTEALPQSNLTCRHTKVQSQSRWKLFISKGHWLALYCCSSRKVTFYVIEINSIDPINEKKNTLS